MATKELTREDTAPMSFSDSESSYPSGCSPTCPIIYSDEELDAMRQVRAKLSTEHNIEPSRVGSAFLAVATINCKLRVDETADKIFKLLGLMEKLGCEDGIDDELWKPHAKHELKAYSPVGRDHRGCSITWINGGGRVSKEEERCVIPMCTCCANFIMAWLTKKIISSSSSQKPRTCMHYAIPFSPLRP